MRLCGAGLGRTLLSEPILDYEAIVDIGSGPNVASAVSNPVAPAHNNSLTSRTEVRDFCCSASAGATIGGTRDLVHFRARREKSQRS